MRWLLLGLCLVLLQGGVFCCSDEEAKLELEQMIKVSMLLITGSGDFFFIEYVFKLLPGIWIPNMYL